jgi:hypothetical protein
MMEWTEDQKLARTLIEKFGGNLYDGGWDVRVSNFVSTHKDGPRPVKGREYSWDGVKVRAVCEVAGWPGCWVVDQGPDFEELNPGRADSLEVADVDDLTEVAPEKVGTSWTVSVGGPEAGWEPGLGDLVVRFGRPEAWRVVGVQRAVGEISWLSVESVSNGLEPVESIPSGEARPWRDGWRPEIGSVVGADGYGGPWILEGWSSESTATLQRPSWRGRATARDPGLDKVAVEKLWPWTAPTEDPAGAGD